MNITYADEKARKQFMTHYVWNRGGAMYGVSGGRNYLLIPCAGYDKLNRKVRRMLAKTREK